jgi:hypothetical protein
VGFAGDPTQMTEGARLLFLNAIAELSATHRLTSQITTPTSTIAAISAAIFA